MGKLVFSPPRNELHRSDVELLPVRDVLSVGELHGSPHRTGETLIHAGRAQRPHQLQACADHVTHNLQDKIRKKKPLSPSTYAKHADGSCQCNQFKLSLEATLTEVGVSGSDGRNASFNSSQGFIVFPFHILEKEKVCQFVLL